MSSLPSSGYKYLKLAPPALSCPPTTPRSLDSTLPSTSHTGRPENILEEKRMTTSLDRALRSVVPATLQEADRMAVSRVVMEIEDSLDVLVGVLRRCFGLLDVEERSVHFGAESIAGGQSGDVAMAEAGSQSQ